MKDMETFSKNKIMKTNLVKYIARNGAVIFFYNDGFWTENLNTGIKIVQSSRDFFKMFEGCKVKRENNKQVKSLKMLYGTEKMNFKLYGGKNRTFFEK